MERATRQGWPCVEERRGESMRQIGSFLEGLLQRLRRIPVVRVVVALVLGVLTLQAAVITVLMLVTKRRALRLPPGGFPHPELP